MATTSVAAGWEEARVAEARGGLSGLIKPPASLLGRVRWFFLLAALVLAVAYGINGTAASAAAGRMWSVTILATALLAAVWLSIYLQIRFTLVADLLGAAGIVALGASVPDTRYMQYAVNACIWMRALHGTVRQTTVATVLYLVAFWAGAALAGTSGTPLVPFAVSRTFSGLVLAVLFSSIAVALAAYGRTIARERRLRLAGDALAEADDRESIQKATLDGARQLLADVPGATVELEGLPDSTGGTTAAVGTPGTYRVALLAHGRDEGALAVSSGRPLDDELRDALQTLADLAALAIESQMLLAARSGGTSEAPPAQGATPFERARAMVGSVVSAASAPTQAASEQPLWRVPQSLPARVQWAFLVSVSLLALWSGLYSLVTAVQGPFTPLQIVGITTPLWLGAWLVYGYRRRRFPLAGDVAIVALLVALILSARSTAAIDVALYGSVVFRAQWGRGWRTVVAVALLVAVVPLAAAASSLWGIGTVEPASLIVVPVTLAVLAAAMYFVAATIRRYERALARERALRVTGALLIAATDRDHVSSAVVDGARALLAGEAGATASITLDPQMTGAPWGTLQQGQPVELASAEAGTWPGLDLERRPSLLFVVPLHARGALEGALVTGSNAPLEPAVKDDLRTLAALAALALEDVALSEP